LRLRGDILYLYEDGRYRLVVPKNKREWLIKSFHKTLGHVGIEKSVGAIRGEFYWPKMNEDIATVITTCIECQHNKYLNGRIKAPLQCITANMPFQILGIDITGPFNPTKHGYRYILGVIDYFSKYVSLIPVRNIEAENIAKELWIHWISKFGVPERIHSDCGSNFQSNFFREYCKLLGINKTFTSPYYPQSDGLTERLFRTAKSMIAAVMEERKTRDWSEVIPTVEFGLRTTGQKSTGFSPYEILFGKPARLPLSATGQISPALNSADFLFQLKQDLNVIHEKVKDKMKRGEEYIAERYNRNKWNREANIGDLVLVKNEERKGFEKKFIGPFVIKDIIGKWTYVLYSDKLRKTIRRNFNQVKLITRNAKSNTKDTSIWSRRTVVKTVPIDEQPKRKTRNQNPRYTFDCRRGGCYI